MSLRVHAMAKSAQLRVNKPLFESGYVFNYGVFGCEKYGARRSFHTTLMTRRRPHAHLGHPLPPPTPHSTLAPGCRSNTK